MKDRSRSKRGGGVHLNTTSKDEHGKNSGHRGRKAAGETYNRRGGKRKRNTRHDKSKKDHG